MKWETKRENLRRLQFKDPVRHRIKQVMMRER